MEWAPTIAIPFCLLAADCPRNTVPLSASSLQLGQCLDLTNCNYEVRIIKVENRLDSFALDIGEINSSMKEIVAAIDAKGTPNWQAVTLFAMVLLAFLGWGWALFGGYQSRT